MNNLNYVFFEEFKSLDKLCGDLYNVKHGVTSYIDDMKKELPGTYNCVPNWESDLKQLVKLRHIRNQLAHAEGSFREECCTQSDIEWVINFHKRILRQSDPLAVLYQKLRIKKQISKQSNTGLKPGSQYFLHNSRSETKNQPSARHTGSLKNNPRRRKRGTPPGVKILLTVFVLVMFAAVILLMQYDII